MIADDLMRELALHQLPYELITHTPTHTADEEAVAVGAASAEVAKTIVLTTPDGFVRAVIPASERLDVAKVRELVGGGKRTRLATESELASAYPMFELGAVPPFAGPAGDRVVVDPRLAKRQSVVLDAGSHSDSVRVSSSDLLLLSGAEVADLCRA